MKVTIIEFSPSGNTNKVGEVLKARLQQNNISIQLVNIAGNKEYFLSNNKQKFLQETVKEHDILFIGSPVYAHHLQYHIKELIESLPKPINGWGKIARALKNFKFFQYGYKKKSYETKKIQFHNSFSLIIA